MALENKTFILNDESVNSYGFVVKTDGIELSQMQDNPVMLYGHNDDELLPIGKWVNFRVVGTQLLADAQFDEADEFAVRVHSKIENGYLKCTSIGFSIEEMLGDTEIPIVTKCILKEASIVPIGSNKNAKLVKLSAGDLNTITKLKNNKNHMKTILTHLKLSDTSTEVEALVAIQKLEAENVRLAQELADVKQIHADKETAEKTSLLALALSTQRITAKEQSIMVKMELSDVRELLAERKVESKSIAAQLTGSAKKLADKEADYTFEDYRKHNPNALAEMKLNDPTRYNELKDAQYTKA